MRTSTTLLLALAFLGVPLPGAALETLQVIVFPGGFNWPVWAAQERGFFARDGLEVELTPTPSSVFQLTNLIEGKFDIGMTAIDNVIAYQEGQGEASVSGTPDLFAFMGGDNGFLRLVVQPEITGYAELRGKALSVDALTTVYAFVLRKMLERGGLREGDYTLVRAGGGLQRFEALKGEKHAGTLLITPFEILAESAGLRRLGNAVDVLCRSQSLVGRARQVIVRNLFEGVVVTDSAKAVLISNTIVKNGGGVAFLGSSRSQVTGNIVGLNKAGFVLGSSSQATISYNALYNSEHDYLRA